MSSVMDMRNRQSERQLGSGSFWARLRRVLLRRAPGVETQCGRGDPMVVVMTPSLVAAASCDEGRGDHSSAQSHGGSSSAGSAVILPFPIHGEALLVKLAEALRNRVADCSPLWDPLLRMSRCPRSRLTIDGMAYIEFHQDRSEYRVVIEASPGTKVILETADFDALADFVLQYVLGRLAEPAALEAAS